MDWLVSVVRTWLDGWGSGTGSCFVLTAIVLWHVYKVEGALSERERGGDEDAGDDADADVVSEPR